MSRPASRDCIYIHSGSGQYVRLLLSAVEGVLAPGKVVVAPTTLTVRPTTTAVLHLQWIEWVFRCRPLYVPYRLARLLLRVAFARLIRVPIVLTLHNVPGKAHDWRATDILLRRILIRAAGSVVVLTPGGGPAVAASLRLTPKAASRFRERLCVVPHPLPTGVHGPQMSRAEALRRLGLPPSCNLVFYRQGKNQPDRADALADALGGTTLTVLELRPTSGTLELNARGASKGFICTGKIDDADFGLLMSACRFVATTDPMALGSMIIATATCLERPLFGVASPAASFHVAAGAGLFLRSIESAEITDRDLDTADQMSVAAQQIRSTFSDAVVGRAMVDAYDHAVARLPVMSGRRAALESAFRIRTSIVRE